MSSPSELVKTRNHRGRIIVPFECGETLTIIEDPAHCYMVGGVYPKGHVAVTLHEKCWANGTIFRTVTEDGWLIEYKVYGRAFITLKRECLGDDCQDIAVRPYVAG